jgi:hypothetical protein
MESSLESTTDIAVEIGSARPGVAMSGRPVFEFGDGVRVTDADGGPP